MSDRIPPIGPYPDARAIARDLDRSAATEHNARLVAAAQAQSEPASNGILEVLADSAKASAVASQRIERLTLVVIWATIAIVALTVVLVAIEVSGWLAGVGRLTWTRSSWRRSVPGPRQRHYEPLGRPETAAPPERGGAGPLAEKPNARAISARRVSQSQPWSTSTRPGGRGA